MSRIYLASSWRNTMQPDTVKVLEGWGHKVYNFRNPPNKAGFQWKDIEDGWQSWTPADYRRQLMTHPNASFGYLADFRAMQLTDTCVLLLPCGRSAHLEAGWAKGANKRLIIFMIERQEPELMYLMADEFCLNFSELRVALAT